MPVSLIIGQKVIYPCRGPCRIGALIKIDVDGEPMAVYTLTAIHGGGEIFVPLEKIEAVGIRPLLPKAEVPRLLNRLRQPAHFDEDRRQRNRDFRKLLASGSAYELAEIVESLTELIATKPLSFCELRLLNRARTLLIYEIREVIGQSAVEAEEQIDLSLRIRIKQMNGDSRKAE